MYKTVVDIPLYITLPLTVTGKLNTHNWRTVPTSITSSSREIVKLLLEYDASPNIIDSKGSSPLHLAAWSGNVDIVRLLLSGPAICNVNLMVSLYIKRKNLKKPWFRWSLRRVYRLYRTLFWSWFILGLRLDKMDDFYMKVVLQPFNFITYGF